MVEPSGSAPKSGVTPRMGVRCMTIAALDDARVSTSGVAASGVATSSKASPLYTPRGSSALT